MKGAPEAPIFVQGLAINRPHHVWAADITDVRLRSGFVSLVVIIAGTVGMFFPVRYP